MAPFGLNRRIKRELVRGRDGFDLKNGEGGIREIEFFTQALQLIHAGKRPQLRCRGPPVGQLMGPLGGIPEQHNRANTL